MRSARLGRRVSKATRSLRGRAEPDRAQISRSGRGRGAMEGTAEASSLISERALGNRGRIAGDLATNRLRKSILSRAGAERERDGEAIPSGLSGRRGETA